ncbi:recombinase family protein [Ureibacillus sp. FSL W8-0352]|uniref:recombinase family protein n=1 Tax=Ureibacillus sp. FSL W8-0352 TaxID=2954596 RepID=UPI0030FCDEDD
MIFELYLGGFSIIGIKQELEKRGIKTPTGKEKWSKRTIMAAWKRKVSEEVLSSYGGGVPIADTKSKNYFK